MRYNDILKDKNYKLLPITYSTKIKADLTESARPANRKLADAVLRNAGYKRLGHGDYGAVYQKPGKSYVLKIFDAHDEAFIDFVNLAMEHKDNPHFPKFIGKIVQVTPNYSAIRMERLTPLVNAECIIPIQTYIKSGGKDDRYEEMEYDPQLKQACDLIIGLLHIHDEDIKTNNIMLRGKTIVFVDPFALNGYAASYELTNSVDLPYVDYEEENKEQNYKPDDDKLMKDLGL